MRLQEGCLCAEKPVISCLRAFLHLGQRQRENRGRQVQVGGPRPGCVLGWETTPETLSERGPSQPRRGLSPPTRTPPTSQKCWGQSFRRAGSAAATSYLDPSRTSWLNRGQRAVGTMERRGKRGPDGARPPLGWRLCRARHVRVHLRRSGGLTWLLAHSAWGFGAAELS